MFKGKTGSPVVLTSLKSQYKKKKKKKKKEEDEIQIDNSNN